MQKKNKKRISIGLLMDSLLDDYGIKIWEGVIDAAKKNDIDLFTYVGGTLKTIHFGIDNRNQIFKLVHSNRVDGLVVISGSICINVDNKEIMKFFEQFESLPIVSVGVPVKKYYSIQIDNISSFKKLIEHFINYHGYKNIAFITGLKGNYEAELRLNIFKELLKKNKIKINKDLIINGNFLYDSGTKAVKELIDIRKISFDAIIAANDYMAIAAMKELQQRGIKVPEQVAVAGFDNISSCYFTTPQLTTIGQLPYLLGNKAVTNLISIIQNKKVPRLIEIPCNLLIRQSCGCNMGGNLINYNENKKSFDFEDLDESEYNNLLYDDVKVSITNYFPKMISHKKLDEVISRICTSLYKIIKSVDISEFYVFFNEILIFSKNERIELIFWNDVFFNINKLLIKKINFSEEANLFIKKFFSDLKKEILKNSIESVKENIFEQDTYDWRTVFISRFFISILSMSKLEKIILSEYPPLGIPSLYLSLFENENDYNYSKLKIAYKDNVKIDINEKKFYSYNLFPDNHTDNKRKHYIVMPLFFEERHFGFIVYEYGIYMGKIYEFLSNQLSGVIQHIKMFNKISEYTKKLEDKVKERTIKLENAYNDLKKIDNMKNDFIANITHDFRSPLTAILNIADLRIMHNEDNLEEKENYEIIYDASIKLKNSIDKLLEIAKMDSQGIKLKVREVDIVSIVKMNIDFYTSSVTGSNIKVVGKFPYEYIDNFYTDREKFEEVLNNVISNAVKFVDLENGKITVSLIDKKYSIIICVEDNGGGIPKDKLESIFNRFEQAHEGRDSKYRGTGIGLAYSKQIIQYLHGKIWAESEGKGKGTKIFIELIKGKDFFHEKDFDNTKTSKIDDFKNREYKELIKSEISRHSHKDEIITIFNDLNQDNEYDFMKGVILIIDDEKNIRLIVMKYLEKFGFKNFILASNGKLGLNAVYEYSPDLIISDFNMPGLRGDAFHDIVSSNPKYKNIPFIFLSAIADTNIIYERKQKGASAYLKKPIETKELLFTAEYHLKKYFEYLILVQQAMIDELTGINNRRSLMKMLKHEMSIRKYRNISIIFFDVDNFKLINDKYGHKTGDVVLKTISKCLMENIRDYDICGRYAGDEFIIILPESDGEESFGVAENIREKIKKYNIINKKHGLKVTLSFGVSSLLENEKYICEELQINNLKSIFEVNDPKITDWKEIAEYKQKISDLLIRMSDQALYEAKAGYCKKCGFKSIKPADFVCNKCPECGSLEILAGKDRSVLFL